MFVSRSNVLASIAALTLSVISASPAKAATLFFDSLQGNLSQFASNNSGVISAAPTGGNALSFRSGGSGGDLFTNTIAGTGAGTFTISFDVLGNCGFTSQCGGFIGMDQTPGGEHWLTSDTPYSDSYGPAVQFADAATFQHVSFSFTSVGAFRLKLEDFAGSAHQTPNGVYFRNLQIDSGTLASSTPEPASLSLLGMGLAGVAMLRRRLS